MIGKVHAVALDCPDPLALAEFYSGVLGGRVEPEGDDWVDVILPDQNLRVSFQLCEGYVAPVWPSDDGDQQVHLDIAVDDFEDADRRLSNLGARRVQKHPTFWVYIDPVGHPFCIVHGDD